MSRAHITGPGRRAARRRVHATIGVAVLLAALGGGSSSVLAADPPQAITVWTQWNQAEADEVSGDEASGHVRTPGVGGKERRDGPAGTARFSAFLSSGAGAQEKLSLAGAHDD